MAGLLAHHVPASEADHALGVGHGNDPMPEDVSTQYLFTTAGAPRQPINVLTLNIYYTAIKDHSIGRASAMSVLLFLVMLVFTWLQLRLSRTEDVTYM